MVRSIKIPALFSTLVAILLYCASLPAEPLEIRFIYLGSTSSSAYPGALQGLSESNLQGQFLGQSYTLEVADPDLLDQILASKPQAILADVNSKTLLRIARALPGIAVINLGESDDALRSQCEDNLLHVIPSNKMRADAVAQWKEKKPKSSPSATAWHHDFVKYAARDLNKRYKKKQGKPMDSKAWAGWAAVRIISDTVARTQSTASTAILAYVKEQLEFDGQKGIVMNFRNNGQLRQPLLLSEQGKLLGEAPVRGVVDTGNLDSLGNIACQ